MIKLIENKKGITFFHIWFEEDENLIIDEARRVHADIIQVHGKKERMRAAGVQGKKQWTFTVDLSKTMDEVVSGFNKNYRYEIRRAGKEGVKAFHYDSSEITDLLLLEYEKLYNAMYRDKGIDNSLNLRIIRQYIQNEMLLLSFVENGGVIVAVHSYIKDREHARLHHSASLFRETGKDANEISRANKYLHCEDMKRLKDNGVKSLDLGGISDRENWNGIDLFKKGFTKNEPEGFWYQRIGITIKGKAALRVLGAVGK